VRLKDFMGAVAHNPLATDPFVIAEAGVNHEGSMDLAFRLIDEAREGGADAIKFQTYRAETIASKHSPYYWDISKEPTRSQYDLFKKYDKFWKKEFETLKQRCDESGIEFLSTPFDRESAVFLNDLMDVYKISSSDLTNKPFIELISSFGKPVLLSTGAAYLHEIEEALSWMEGSDVPVALLHCVLNYPTPDSDANLGMIPHMKAKFPSHAIGYSDHTLPGDMENLEIAYLLGAVILEKHFTFDKSLPGNDHYHAMDKEDLKRFKVALDRIRIVIGNTRKAPLPSEWKSRENARRSLVIAREVVKGSRLVPEDLTWKRPASGVSPRFFSEVVGMEALEDLHPDDVLHWWQIR
jgi:N-acetylneuraminate synthase